MHTFTQKPKTTQQARSATSSSLRRSHSVQSREASPDLQLQRLISNQAVEILTETNKAEFKGDSTTSRLAQLGQYSSPLSSPPALRTQIQAKLTVNTPGDSYEQEADRVSDQVMRMQDPKLQRSCDCEGECPQCEEAEQDLLQLKTVADQITPLSQPAHIEKMPLHTKAQGYVSMDSTDLESEVTDLSGGGQPLSKASREFFEPRFGRGFNNVRIHNDVHANQLARRVSAKAFTHGNHVVFGAGEYAPESHSGKRLLGHELTHVVQQGKTSAGSSAAGTVQRFDIKTEGTAPHGWANVPEDEVNRLARAQNIVLRVIYRPACRDYFRDNTPSGTNTTAQELYNNVDLWKHPSQSRRLYGEGERPGSSMAYTQHAYNIGAWTLAGTFIHELMHNGGQSDEETCENALHPCGRLPQVPVGTRDSGGIEPVRPGLPFFMSEVRRLLGDPDYHFIDHVGGGPAGWSGRHISVDPSDGFWATAHTAQVRNLAEEVVEGCCSR